jgi:peptidoglycan hydrolase-like protein with peptidoglycan-binding domain
MRRLAIALLSLPALALASCGSVSAPAPSARPTVSTQVPSSRPPLPARTSPAPAPTPSATSPTRPTAQHGILEPGMSGPAVTTLQQRLAALGYYPGSADGQFGADTLEAVWAFQEAQGLPAQDAVGQAMQYALMHPRPPPVLVPDGGSLRIEINLADELLVFYRAGQPVLISHVSTGGGYYYCSPGGGCGYAVTPTGDFSTTSFIPGWVTVPLGEMYNPVFFIDTAYAIHGDTYVPLQPVSHGCVRIPMDIAQFFYTLVPVPGTPVYIRG